MGKSVSKHVSAVLTALLFYFHGPLTTNPCSKLLCLMALFANTQALVSVADVALSIGAGLAKAALAGNVDGKLVDTSYVDFTRMPVWP
jgi:hypothetical protein